jgi:Icc-related predicted phosphoesterase
MKPSFFVSDLHGQIPRYLKLFEVIRKEKPSAVFLGGDLLPHGVHTVISDTLSFKNFLLEFMQPGFEELRQELGRCYPQVFLILGNDDPRALESNLAFGENSGLWDYIPNRRVVFGDYLVYGYPHVPPTPFLLKDWERYDVSRFVDPGCLSPEEGWRTVPVSQQEMKFTTIEQDLKQLAASDNLSNAIFLFHSPPYRTKLDLLEVAGKTVDHAPLDVHAGSIAIKRFIETRQPLVTLHGHLHESPRLSSDWKCRIGRTFCFSAAHDGPELALVRFDLHYLQKATRQLLL